MSQKWVNIRFHNLPPYWQFWLESAVLRVKFHVEDVLVSLRKYCGGMSQHELTD